MFTTRVLSNRQAVELTNGKAKQAISLSSAAPPIVGSSKEKPMSIPSAESIPRPQQLHFIPAMSLRESAELLHRLYHSCPTYISLIGGEAPSLNDIERELETLRHDTRRQAMLILEGEQMVGFLDYKVAYPDLHAATISLLLVDEKIQGRGLGRLVVEQLEALLKGRTERLYAVVYGNNERAKTFWKRCGFAHLRDSGPSLGWYEKELLTVDS